MICKNCGRETKIKEETCYRSLCNAVSIRGYHSYYGCDTGCCGYTIEIVDEDDEDLYYHFWFDHPNTENEAIDLLLSEIELDRKLEYFLKSLPVDFQDLGAD